MQKALFTTELLPGEVWDIWQDTPREARGLLLTLLNQGQAVPHLRECYLPLAKPPLRHCCGPGWLTKPPSTL